MTQSARIYTTPAALAGGVLLLATSLCLTGSPVLAANSTSHTDVARFLAGMEPASGSPLAKLTKESKWRTHAKKLDKTWAKIEKRQLSKIRSWSKEHIKTPNKSMLYMFSGPDYLYANAFFPDTTTYVFAGLEPVGTEPDLLKTSSGRRSAGLANLRNSLSDIVKLSYFITKDMNEKLHGRGFRGTIPVLYVFLARAGKTIDDITFVKLDDDGTLTTVDTAPKRRPSGVRIDFSDGPGAAKKSLYYFSIDLSNSSLKKNGFLAFMDSLGPADSFFKSASYLPHYNSFSVIRNFILKRADRIVQDDTGVQLKHYDLDKWNVAPFGNYTRPIPVFKGRYQPAMKRYFRKMKAPKLNFGIGYRFRPHNTSMLLATKKSAQQAKAEPAITEPAKTQ